MVSTLFLKISPTPLWSKKFDANFNPLKTKESKGNHFHEQQFLTHIAQDELVQRSLGSIKILSTQSPSHTSCETGGVSPFTKLHNVYLIQTISLQVGRVAVTVKSRPSILYTILINFFAMSFPAGFNYIDLLLFTPSLKSVSPHNKFNSVIKTCLRNRTGAFSLIIDLHKLRCKKNICISRNIYVIVKDQNPAGVMHFFLKKIDSLMHYL